MIKYTANLKTDYEDKWNRMVITKLSQAEKVRDLILRGKARYETVSKETGVPWEFIGLTHYRECACNFRGVLHNGELIVGTNKLTKLVPAGYGPFATWEEAALSALRRQGLHKEKDWSIGKTAFLLEGFNGYGYHFKGIPSPYLWGGSNQYVRGKYVRDRVFDPNFVDPQMGCLPVLQLLRRIPSRLPIDVPKPAETIPPIALPPKKPPVKEGVAVSVWAGVIAYLENHRWELLAAGVVLVALVVAYRWHRSLVLSRSSPKTE